MKRTILIVLVLAFAGTSNLAAQSLTNITPIKSFIAGGSASKMQYSPDYELLFLLTSAAVRIIDTDTQSELGLHMATERFTDIHLTPDGHYFFAADFGEETVYGDPVRPHYVHRYDLATGNWEVRRAPKIAHRLEAVSAERVLLLESDQWVQLTLNSFGTEMIELDRINCNYRGDIEYDSVTGRVYHGDFGTTRNEIYVRVVVGDTLGMAENTSLTGNAEIGGGTVVLSTDGDKFYYGRLQVEGYDVRINGILFPQMIYAASPGIAFGQNTYYNTASGGELGSLGFATSVYALSTNGKHLWALDPASTTLHYYIIGSFDWPFIDLDTEVFEFVSPENGPNPPDQSLHIQNIGIGTVNWKITNNCPWLQVIPQSGSTTVETDEITLRVDTASLPVLNYECVLIISDPNAINSPEYVTVNLYVRRPLICVTPTQLDFSCGVGGPNPEPQTLSVWNDDVGTLNWEITEDCNWLEVWPTNGQSSGEVNEVIISIDANGLDVGEYSCVLTVSDPNAINSPQEVTVNLDVRPPVIGITPTVFNFVCPLGGPNPEPQMLSVWNDDLGTLNWEITEDCNWLEIDPNSGTSAGEIDEVALNVDIAGLALGTYNCTLMISDPDALNSPQTVSVALHICGETVYVPDDFFTIQDAIDHTLEGGTVVVADGTYTGTGNHTIDFKGKAITVRSENGPENCVIDCNGMGRGFYFHSGESENSVLDGFTIANGYTNAGAAIWCRMGSPTITNCILSGNTASDRGGAIYFQDGRPKLTNCTIIGNTAGSKGGGIYSVRYCSPTISSCTVTGNTAVDGGGIYCYLRAPTIKNCTITGNAATNNGGGLYLYQIGPRISTCMISCNRAAFGGGVYCYQSSPEMLNCTFSGNYASNDAGGMFCDSDSAPVLTNCILWTNRDNGGTDESAQIYGGSPYVSFSCIQDDDPNDTYIPFGDANSGNIDDVPMFIRDPNDGGDGWGVGNNDDLGDLHLQVDSPCINAGDPNFVAVNQTDIDGQPRVMGQRVDMGADEFFMATVVITKPGGGEVWVSGSIHEIGWRSHLYEGTVDLLFSKDSGENWQTIGSSVSDTGNYMWHLPDIVDSNQCLVLAVPSIPDANVVRINSGLFTIHPDSPDPSVASKWKSLGGNFRRTGLSENYGPEYGCVKWQFETKGAVSASITIGVDERVHIACEDGTVYALDASGVLLWSYNANSPLVSSPTIGPDGTVYVGSQNGKLYAIDITGSLRWTHTTSGPIYSSPAVSPDGRIYVCSQDGILCALGPDGSELWDFEMDGPAQLPSSTFASPAIGADGTIYIAGLYDPNLYAIEPNDGSVKWTCNFEFPIDPCDPNSEMEGGWPFASPVIGPDGTIYQTLLYDSYLYAIEPNAGTIIWSTDLADPCSGWFGPNYAEDYGDADGWSEPTLGPDGTIYVSFDDPYLRAVEPNGNIKWVAPLGSVGGFTLTVGSNGLIYAASDDSRLYVVDPNGWEVARFQGDHWLSLPVIAADSTIVVCGVNDDAILTGDENSTVWAIRQHGCEDLNADEAVNLIDFALLAAEWLNCTDTEWPCNYDGEELYVRGDINRDQYVDFSDLAAMADRWLDDVKWLKLLTPPGQASNNPNPADGATNVSISADLSWTAGSDATSHDVYFGTTSPGIFQGNQTATTFDPGIMRLNTTYYWRIDEVSPSGTTTGTVWSFTTTRWPPV